MKKFYLILKAIFVIGSISGLIYAQNPLVEFRCNMSVQIKRGTFNPATDSVWVRGNFNDWAGKATTLIDPDGDSIYSRVFYNEFSVGQSLIFKYVHSPDVWEATGNRTLTVASGANLTSAYWEDVSVYKPTKIIKVAFSVNMELERLSGLFNPAVNQVSVRGSFNGWGESLMTPSTANADLYEVTTDVIAAVDEKISFKFFYSPGTWEVNNLDDPSQNDRFFIVTQAVFDSGFMAYDAIGFNNQSLGPYPYNQKLKITCNTVGAKILNAPDGTEFQTVHVLGVPSDEYNIENYLPKDVKLIQLNDDGIHGDVVAGDKIFSVDTVLTFPVWCIIPPWFSISYKYSANYNLPTNGGSNDNEVISGGYHASYFTLFDPIIKDTFGISNITEVKQENYIPISYRLDQNYPNPFNPETVINYQLAASAWVTLKVFDVLGNEVATLVNEEQSAGSYRIEFSSKNTELSSGVFFYQLRAGDFVQTKKMILMK